MKIDIAYTHMGEPEALDPAKIVNIEQYQLIHNLFSRIVKHDEKGRVVPDLASDFYWENEYLVFEFNRDVTTKSGHKVSAQDAATSLLRTIQMGGSGHWDLKSLVCSTNNSCEGIRAEGHRLILYPKSKSRGEFLLGLLTNADFSIIPMTTISDQHVLDLSETSGPYYLKKIIDVKGHTQWELNANSGHFLYSREMPQKVHLTKIREGIRAKDIVDLDINFIPGSVILTKEETEIVTDQHQWNIVQSRPNAVRMLYFSPNALKSFSIDERIYIGNLISKTYALNTLRFGETPTLQFFQPSSSASLDDSSLAEYSHLRNKNPNFIFHKKVKFGVGPTYYESALLALKDHPEIEVVKYSRNPFELPVEERPDAYVFTNDASWEEDLSLLGYNIGFSYFHLPQQDLERWLDEYVDTENRSIRQNKLIELHRKLLFEAAIFPLMVSAYNFFLPPNVSSQVEGEMYIMELWSLSFKQ